MKNALETIKSIATFLVVFALIIAFTYVLPVFLWVWIMSWFD